MKKAVLLLFFVWIIHSVSCTSLYAQDIFEPPGGDGGDGPSSACCGGDCPPPPPSPPGGDHPDETFSVDSGNPPIEPYFTSDPHAVILANGNYNSLISLLSFAKKSTTKADIDTPAPDLLSSSPVFVIPSGGLYGMENSAFFKAALEEYVKAGGTLIVFAQQHGYEFSILPVPQETDGSYKQINGYGWTEDQACFANAAYIDTWHPMLGGQSRSTPTLNVDGYFTIYPTMSTVLLRRTANSYPAMLIYSYGLGRVIVTSLYSDYAFGHSQASSEEIALVRDVVLWATAPAQFPEIKRSETVTVQVPVTNLATTGAASAKFYISAPNKSSVVSQQVFSISLPPGQSTTTSVSYTAPSNAALGIYPVEYELFDSQGNIVQPKAEARSGHFAVSQPPGTAYQPGSTYQIWVTTPIDHVARGSDVTFTIHIKNNTSTALVNAQIGIGSHEQRSEGGAWWVYREAIDGIDISAGQTVEVPWTFRVDISQSIYFGLFRSDQNPNTDFVGGGLARTERGVWVLKPSVKLSVQADRPHYGRGETVNLSLNIQNLMKFAYTTILKVRVSDPSNVSVYNTELTINLPAQGTSNQSTGFSLPSMSPPGFYTVSAEAYDTNGSTIGSDNTGFDLPKLFLSVTPTLPSVFTSSNSISFRIENRGVLLVSSAVLSVSLKDPADAEIWSNQAQVSSLQSGQSADFAFSMPIASIVFGEYKLGYALSYEGQINNGEHLISNIPVIKLTIDNPSHRMRETAYLAVEVNAGKLSLSGVTETVSAPDLTYTDAKPISFSPTQASQETYAIPIPGTVTAGQHNVQVTLALPSGSSITQSSQIMVPESSLIIQYSGLTALKLGDTVIATLENTGGVDTNYTTEKLSLSDGKGTTIYQGSAPGSILAGEKKALTTFQIPSQAADGQTILGIDVRDTSTSKLSSFYKILDIDGIAVTLQTKTSKDAYLNTEAITALSNIANGQVGMDQGSLKVAVSTSGESETGVFRHFLPLKGWAFFDASSVAIGPDGSMYVVDGINDYIQKFDSSGKFLTKWGSHGGGDGQFYYPEDAAVGPDGSVYVMDTNNYRVQKFDGSGNFLTKWGSQGSGDGQFEYPNGVAVGPDGSVYVMDSYNSRVQKFDSNGNFLAKWGSQGSGDGQFHYAYRVAVGPDGSVYVADNGNHRIQKFDGSGNFLAKWGSQGSGDGQFYGPYAVAVGSDSAVYVADRLNDRIQKFDSSGTFLTKWGSQGSGNGQFDRPYGVAAGPDGSVYVADPDNDRIQKFDSNGTFLAKWGSPASDDGHFNEPYGVATGPDGSMYVADTYNHRIQKFDTSGSFLTKWGNDGSGNGQFDHPHGVAVWLDGSVYVADTYNHRIQKFDTSGNFLTKWGSPSERPGSGDGQFNSPYGVAVGPDGSVYVADAGNNRIQKFDSSGNFILKWGSWGSDDGQFGDPRGVAAGPDGSVYVADNGYHDRIQKFDGSGNFILKWGSRGSDDGQFYDPRGIAVGLDGSVYVADTDNERVQKFDGSGNFLAKWGSHGNVDGQFYYPHGVAAGLDGSVYAADTYNHRIQRLVAANGSGIGTLFETTIPVTQQANTTQDYITNIGALNATGKLYLNAVLKNSLGQTLAESKYPFYVIQGNTVLSFDTDKQIYKPGETVTIAGKVENKSSVAVTGVTLTLNSQLSGQGSQVLLTETFDVPGNGSHLFSATAVAGSAGTYTLSGKVTQGGSTLVEIKDSYEVASPKLSVTVTAPDVVGNETFLINVEIKNEGKGAAVLNLQSSVDGQTQAITIPAGETKPVQYIHQIASDTVYTFTFTGDLEQTVTKTVLYGLSASIAMTPQTAYPEGKVSVPVTLTNTGQLDETLMISYSLQPSALTQAKTYFLPKTGNVTDTLYFDLTDGEYQLTAASSQPTASATATVSVRKENKAQLSTTSGSLTNGLLPVTVTVTNAGYKTIGGSVLVSLVSNQGTVVWSDTQVFADLPPLQSQAVGFGINPASILPGIYTLNVVVHNSAGQEIGNYSSFLEIKGANFLITQLPGFQTVAAGGQATFSYTVKNGGNQGGSFDLQFRAADFNKSIRTEWLNAGEEKPVVFTVTVPGDVEEKDYFADHELRTAAMPQPVVKGQVKYHVTGINLSVTASLDKEYYQEGETAHLTLLVSQPGAGGPNLSARVNYSGFEDQQAFTLDGSQAIEFDVPVNKITGEKLFYGIYTETGRSIHLNSLYVYGKGDVLRIMTGKQVYNPGEDVLVTIDSVGGSVSGTLTLTGPSYAETLTFAGSATRGFPLPSVMKAGTYYINAQLITTTLETLSASHPFDVAGISIKLKEATLDKAKYASTDTVKVDLIVESNKSVPVTLRSWIVSPEGTQQAGQTSLNLTSSDPVQYTGELPLTNAKSGIHRLSYGIYTTVNDPQSGSTELLLASGAEAFDVGSVMLYSLSTDKADYPTGTEPVTATVTAYGTMDATLELKLDDVTITTETISFSGTVTLNTNIGIVNPGPHTLKAILTAGGVETTKETTFTYAMSLYDSDYDGVPTQWENAHGLDPNNPDDANLDPDNDGLTNIEEYWSGTDPRNPDTDNDGMDDGWEVTYGLDPLVNDASGDKDGDGYSNLFEYQKGSNPGDPASVPMPAQISVERVLLQENFASGIPESWFVAGAWGSGCEGGRSVGAPFEAPWAIVDSACAGTSDERLYAPIFDASSCSTVTLRFSSFFEPGTDGTASIAVSDDYGETWTPAMTMTGTAGPEAMEIDISALARKEEALIGFGYSSPNGTLGNEFWAIDNVEVLCQSAELQFKAPFNVASQPQTLLIRNKGDLDLKIEDIALSGDLSFSLQNDQCTGRTLVSQGECRVDVVFTATDTGTKAGRKTAALKFSSNDPGSPVVEVALSGKGVQFLVEPEEGWTGTEITLTGNEFGMKKGSVLLGTTAMKVLSWQSDSIHVLLSKPVPPGPYDVTVKPKEPKGAGSLKEGNAFTVITNEPPRIFWVSPDHGVVGTEVVVKGMFFGSKGNLYLQYEGSKGPMKKKCKVLKWTMDPATGESEIIFVVPLITAGATDVVVALTAPVPEARQGNGFTMMAPQILRVEPSGGKAGDPVTIRGHYFGTKKGKVYLGGYEVKGKAVKKSCAVLSWAVDPSTGEDVVVFVVPGGLAPDTYDLIITNSVGSDTRTDGFKID